MFGSIWTHRPVDSLPQFKLRLEQQNEQRWNEFMTVDVLREREVRSKVLFVFAAEYSLANTNKRLRNRLLYALLTHFMRNSNFRFDAPHGDQRARALSPPVVHNQCDRNS